MSVHDPHCPQVTGFIWAWAVGGDPLSLSSEMAIPLGGISDAPHLLLQIHYDNYFLKPGLTDPGSGIRIHYRPERPSSGVGIFGIGGHPEATFVVPNRTHNHTVVMQSTVALTGDVSVFGWMLHMHFLGVRGRLEHYRQGQLVGMFGCMGFADQYGVALDGVGGCTREGYRFDYQQV